MPRGHESVCQEDPQLHPRPRFLSRCLQRAPTSTSKLQNLLTIIITSISILITNNIHLGAWANINGQPTKLFNSRLWHGKFEPGYSDLFPLQALEEDNQISKTTSTWFQNLQIDEVCLPGMEVEIEGAARPGMVTKDGLVICGTDGRYQGTICH